MRVAPFRRRRRRRASYCPRTLLWRWCFCKKIYGTGFIAIRMQASQEERFLGFDPAHFIDDVHNVATDYAADCIDKVEEELLNDPVVGPMHAEMLSKGVEKAYEIVKQRLDVNFDKFELYCLRNIFAVPEHVDLEATMQLAQPPQIKHRYTAQQEADLDAEVCFACNHLWQHVDA
jgi:hypothetical protein